MSHHYKQKNPSVKLDRNYLIIHAGYNYNIPLSQINTQNKLDQKVSHLRGKTWFNPKVEQAFWECISKHNLMPENAMISEFLEEGGYI